MSQDTALQFMIISCIVIAFVIVMFMFYYVTITIVRKPAGAAPSKRVANYIFTAIAVFSITAIALVYFGIKMVLEVNSPKVPATVDDRANYFFACVADTMEDLSGKDAAEQAEICYTESQYQEGELK